MRINIHTQDFHLSLLQAHSVYNLIPPASKPKGTQIFFMAISLTHLRVLVLLKSFTNSKGKRLEEIYPINNQH